MKKFLLGVIFIIPIVVMVAISAAVTIIATATSPLPDQIVIYDDSGTLLKDGDVVECEITDTDRYLTVEVLPVLVKNDGIELELDTESGAGRLKLVREGDSHRYKIVPQAPGAVSAVIRAAANIGVVRELTFIINTREITGVEIFDENGNNIEEISLIKQARVFAEVSPVVALSGYNLTWKSSDESVVKVSTNGMLYPVGRGRAVVSLSALDKRGNIRTDSIVVDTTRALVSSDVIFTSTEITYDWIRSNILLSDASEVSDVGQTEYIVSEEGVSVSLKFQFCAEDEWGFCDGLDVVYTRHIPYFIELCYLGTNVPLSGAELTSDDPSVCDVDGMALLPKKSGTVTIFAAFGGEVKSKVITVRDNPAVLSLNLSSADAKRGIKMTRVWGLQTYAEGQFVNTYQMGTVEDADVVWKTDDATKATVTPEGLVTFLEGSRGRKVVVTASTTVYGKPTGVSRSFTFNILNEDAVNVYSYDDLNAVNNQERYVSVLQSDLESAYEMTLRNSVYGNGFTVSAEIRGSEVENMDSIFNIAREQVEYYDSLSAIVVEDIVLVGRDLPEKSTHVGLDCYRTPNKIILRYIVARNFHTSFDISHCNDVLIEGCILGDNKHHGIMLRYPFEEGYKVTLRNNVLKMSVGPAIAMVPYKFDTEGFGKNYIPELNVEGFLDMYNWKTKAEIGPAFNVFDVGTIDFGGFIDPEYFAKAIDDGLTSLMDSPEMAHIFYTDAKGDKYACMGIFVLGAMFKNDPSLLKISDKNLSAYTMPLSKVSGAAGILIDLVNAFTTSMGMPINNSCYLIGYNFASHDPLVKPGEAVPQNYDLYQRLQSGAKESDSGKNEYDVC